LIPHKIWVFKGFSTWHITGGGGGWATYIEARNGGRSSLKLEKAVCLLRAIMLQTVSLAINL